jgi:hypothetical protein
LLLNTLFYSLVECLMVSGWQLWKVVQRKDFVTSEPISRGIGASVLCKCVPGSVARGACLQAHCKQGKGGVQLWVAFWCMSRWLCLVCLRSEIGIMWLVLFSLCPHMQVHGIVDQHTTLNQASTSACVRHLAKAVKVIQPRY